MIAIETQRLLIREIRKEDKYGLFEMDSDPEVHRYLGKKPISTLEDAEKAIKFIQRQYHEHGIGRWAVIEKKSGNFIGWTGLKYRTDGGVTINHLNYYDLGYRFIRKYWGRGYAQETVAPSLAYGFNQLHLREIFAMAEIENAGSNAILKKAGFRCIKTMEFEGELNNLCVLSKEEWLKFHSPV